MSKTLVTGANGFVGRALVESLAVESIGTIGAVRAHPAAGQVSVGDIGPYTDWGSVLRGCDGVVHLAARVHVMQDHSHDPLAAFRAVNVAGTLNLARQAAASGVHRFVFLSSVKVNGESTGNRSFSETDIPVPEDAYGISKWEAEQGLWEIAEETGMEVIILRPPLIYGPGVKANFLKLMQLVDRGIPLPLASIDNRRSLIYLGNLVDAIKCCLTHPDAAGKTFLVSDGEDVSTPELVRRLAAAMGRPARLLPAPTQIMHGLAKLLGKQEAVNRLVGSLAVDSQCIRSALDWPPRYTLDQGLAETVNWYLQNRVTS